MNPYHGHGGHMPDVKKLCKQYMNFHVIGQMKDGTQMEGIIIDMDDDNVTMLVPEDIDAEQMMNRQFGYDYDGYDKDGKWKDNDYGGYGGYPRPRRRYRRYRRRRYPYGSLLGLLLFPFDTPYGGGYPGSPGYGYGSGGYGGYGY